MNKKKQTRLKCDKFQKENEMISEPIQEDLTTYTHKELLFSKFGSQERITVIAELVYLQTICK